MINLNTPGWGRIFNVLIHFRKSWISLAPGDQKGLLRDKPEKRLTRIGSTSLGP